MCLWPSATPLKYPPLPVDTEYYWLRVSEHGFSTWKSSLASQRHSKSSSRLQLALQQTRMTVLGYRVLVRRTRTLFLCATRHNLVPYGDFLESRQLSANPKFKPIYSTRRSSFRPGTEMSLSSHPILSIFCEKSKSRFFAQPNPVHRFP
jgi:hypothetical protein